jgi:hypothetical protein
MVARTSLTCREHSAQRRVNKGSKPLVAMLAWSSRAGGRGSVDTALCTGAATTASTKAASLTYSECDHRLGGTLMHNCSNCLSLKTSCLYNTNSRGVDNLPYECCLRHYEATLFVPSTWYGVTVTVSLRLRAM